MVNLNDEYMYYVLGQPNDFTYPTGQRIYEQWTPLVLRGTTAVPARYSKQILGGRFAVWGDFPNAQTQDQVAMRHQDAAGGDRPEALEPGEARALLDRLHRAGHKARRRLKIAGHIPFHIRVSRFQPPGRPSLVGDDHQERSDVIRPPGAVQGSSASVTGAVHEPGEADRPSR